MCTTSNIWFIGKTCMFDSLVQQRAKRTNIDLTILLLSQFLIFLIGNFVSHSFSDVEVSKHYVCSLFRFLILSHFLLPYLSTTHIYDRVWNGGKMRYRNISVSSRSKDRFNFEVQKARSKYSKMFWNI